MLWMPPGFAHGFLVLSERRRVPLQDDRLLASGARAHAAVERSGAWHRVAARRRADRSRRRTPPARRSRDGRGLSRERGQPSANRRDAMRDPADALGASGQRRRASSRTLLPRASDDRRRDRIARRSTSRDAPTRDRRATDRASVRSRDARSSTPRAYTAVDRAETRARPRVRRQRARAASILADEAKRLGALLIHYSTDYVFDGARTTPYDEDAPTAPLNVYGESKLEGERAIAASGADALVLRTSWVYGLRGTNFLLTIRRLAARARRAARSSTIRSACRTGRARWRARPPRWSAAGFAYAARARGRLSPELRPVETTWYGFARAIIGDAERPRVVADQRRPSTRRRRGARLRRARHDAVPARRSVSRFPIGARGCDVPYKSRGTAGRGAVAEPCRSCVDSNAARRSCAPAFMKCGSRGSTVATRRQSAVLVGDRMSASGPRLGLQTCCRRTVLVAALAAADRASVPPAESRAQRPSAPKTARRAMLKRRCEAGASRSPSKRCRPRSAQAQGAQQRALRSPTRNRCEHKGRPLAVGFGRAVLRGVAVDRPRIAGMADDARRQTRRARSRSHRRERRRCASRSRLPAADPDLSLRFTGNGANAPGVRTRAGQRDRRGTATATACYWSPVLEGDIAIDRAPSRGRRDARRT